MHVCNSHEKEKMSHFCPLDILYSLLCVRLPQELMCYCLLLPQYIYVHHLAKSVHMRKGLQYRLINAKLKPQLTNLQRVILVMPSP